MSANVITLVQPLLKPRRERLWIAGGKICHWCKGPTRYVDGDPWDQATTDHVIPRYKGGDPGDVNCVSACRLCNNRRSHEDARGLPEGFLLGKYKIGPDGKPEKTAGVKKFNCLTGDDKKALMARMDKVAAVRVSEREVHIQQRDQALKRIVELEKEVEKLRILIQELETMPIIKIARRRLGHLLLDIDNKRRYL